MRAIRAAFVAGCIVIAAWAFYRGGYRNGDIDGYNRGYLDGQNAVICAGGK